MKIFSKAVSKRAAAGLTMAAVAVAAIAVTTGVTTKAVFAQPQWQYFHQPANKIGQFFEIGIRSKFGETTYWATVIVQAPNGPAWSRTIVVKGDAWGKLVFPRDFRAPYRPGAYSYLIIVNGRAAIAEKFRLR